MFQNLTIAASVVVGLAMAAVAAVPETTVADKAAKDCCAQKLACCTKPSACCVADVKLGCCAKGLACCAENRECCRAVQACCTTGSACCDQSKACCGPKAKDTASTSVAAALGVKVKADCPHCAQLPTAKSVQSCCAK